MHRKLLANLVLCVVMLLTSVLALAQGPDGENVEGLELAEAHQNREAMVGAEPQSYPYSGGPDYDSGWVALNQGQSRILTHALGGNADHYVVDMQFKANDQNGVNQRYYGGSDIGDNPDPNEVADHRVGAYWSNLDNSTIAVFRRHEDIYAHRVRIRIWVDQALGANYDSDWFNLPPGAVSKVHNLGDSVDDYVVYLQFKNSGSGINQLYYGGVAFGSKTASGNVLDDRMGAYWYQLTNTSINVRRLNEDAYAVEARIRIWLKPEPTYDSGWVPNNPGEHRALLHSIGGNPDDYVVDMQFRRTGGIDVNARFYGGSDLGAHAYPSLSENDRVGAYWLALNDSTIVVGRGRNDIFAEEVRIRIWSFWRPRMPDYSSGWVSLEGGVAPTVLEHNLGGDTDDYYVDMQHLMPMPRGINQRYFGGVDLGENVPIDHAEGDRVGAFWQALTDSTISVFRRAEDSSAPKVRVRIWVMPKPDYDSGWFAQAAGGPARALNHNLGGNRFDYLVDMQYRNSRDGVNQRYFGGMDVGGHASGSVSEDDRFGAYWRSLGQTQVTVYRFPEDLYADEIRVRIWRVAEPDFDSGFESLAQGAPETLTHNVGGHEGNYLVNMVLRDDDAWGIHTRYLGGADLGDYLVAGAVENDRLGAYWHELTTSSVVVYRRQEDNVAERVRVRIWKTHYNVNLPVIVRNPVEE